jgi:hypothetical protein
MKNMKKNNMFWIVNIFVMIFIICIPVSFSLNIESSNPQMTLTLDKIHEVNIEVKKILIEADEIKSPVFLTEDEQVLLTLTKIKNHPGEADFQQFVDYTLGSEVTMKLVPGDYYISGQYILNREVIIPEKTDYYCKGLKGGWEQTGSSFAGSALMSGVMAAAFLGPAGWVAAGVLGVVALVTSFMDPDDCLGPEEPVTIDEIKMNPAILGGVEGNITLSKNIYSKDKLTFYTFAIPPPQIMEDMVMVSLIKNITSQNIYRIQPR